MSKVRGYLCVGFAFWLVQGCAGPSATQKQVVELQQKINKIQTEQDRLNERLTALELASTLPASGPRRAEDRPELQVVRLGPEESYRDDMETIGSMDDDREPPTVIRAEGDRVPSVQRGSKVDQGALDVQASRDYEKAMDLIGRKRYEEALEALAGFLVRYPGHGNAAQAMFWRGECYYLMGNDVRAAEQFEGVIARFPNGNNAADALLRLGMSQRRMGERDKAARTFERLRKSHPGSDAASRIPRE
jgi:tol-pal system protein YbgF